MKPPFRADHVGSLLRPPYIKQDPERAIREVVARQESVGLESVTDGEFSREWWHLDFLSRLDGVKLKGSWALIRTSGGDGRSWLLLKHRDEWAGPLDIAAFAPTSVKSGGYFTDIIEEQAPAIWTSNRAAKSAPGGLRKIVERAIAITEEEKKGALAYARAAGAKREATTGASKARSTRRKPGASGRAARSPGAKGRPR